MSLTPISASAAAARRRISGQRTNGPVVGSMPEQNVFHHREMRRERKLLVDHRDARLPGVERIARTIRLAVEPHLAFVRLMGAREHFHQRALARAVFADQRQHLAGRDLQIDVVRAPASRRIASTRRAF